MRVIVTGATGNVGTSLIEAAAEAPEITEIVGLARRRPSWSPPKTTWTEADILSSDLAAIFEGADAVVHLAWAIQPSRDEKVTERINVAGSRRVFDAVRTAGAPALIYASSVGAYAEGPKDREVDEAWPLGGVASSFYARHKTAVEQALDRFEQSSPQTRVVRMRPALIFKDEAASEIRRLFAGAFLPTALLRSKLVPAVPRIPGLRFQSVHSADVGEAYVQAIVRDVSGAFNLAAEPPLGSEEIADLFNARTFPLPARVVRALAEASWRLHLQPTSPGWMDMALAVPLMSSARARRELAWEPRYDAVEALEDLLVGMREGEGMPTPPMTPSSPSGRLREVRTGHGERQLYGDDPGEQVLSYLTDLHSIEEQALTQMRKAPEIAGEGTLARAFEVHLAETEGHERRVREMLEARGAEPSRIKDAAGKAGGVAMLLFAGSQPDTPGKLTAHAYAYEHMEIGAYELLRRVAEHAGDEECAALAREIGEEEAEMARRLADSFDQAVDASLTAGSGELDERLNSYLADAHAIEQQALQLLESAPELIEDEGLAESFSKHLEETRGHERRVRERLEARGSSASAVRDAALRGGALGIGGFFGAQPDATAKLSGFAFAFEHLEIAAYEQLARVAARAGDQETASMAESILAEERAAAEEVAASWDRTATVATAT